MHRAANVKFMVRRQKQRGLTRHWCKIGALLACNGNASLTDSTSVLKPGNTFDTRAATLTLHPGRLAPKHDGAAAGEHGASWSQMTRGSEQSLHAD